MNQNWETIHRQTPEWFRNAKFGLFFHWGPYSVPAYKNEWYSRNMYAKKNAINRHHVETYGPLSEFGYKDFYPMMTGTKFDAEEWAELVERSGAKYAGPVTEHSDNFSMWDSQVNEINCVNYGPKRDIYGECAEAFRKRGIKLLATFHHQWLWGWFMSSDPDADVYDPANEKYYWKALPLETNRYAPYRLPDQEFNQMWLSKVNEVIDKYHPDVLYFDSRTNIIDEKYRYSMAKHLYEDPSTVLTYKQEDFPADVGVYDIECGRFEKAKDYAWQTDDRLEDNVTWCMVQNPKYKSAVRIIHQLCDIVSKNGNLLLNVGPYADGSFHPDAKKILFEIGDWLKINGEAIYDTRPYKTAAEGPTAVQDANYTVEMVNAQVNNEEGDAGDINLGAFTAKDFRFTQKDGFLFAIAMGWPSDRTLKIKTLKTGTEHISSITLLGYNGPLEFCQNEEYLEVTLPEQKPCEHAYALKIAIQ
ncbi:MAG: alpha-L-fucosidase [Lachnospiraceae bacterium]|nr:alpha-L-fucosidase [Lachnospiraceae bacterium]